MAQVKNLVTSLSMVLALACPALSTAAGPKWVYPDSQAVSGFPENKSVSVCGKYTGLVEKELHLFDIPLRFVLDDARLARKLLDFRPNADNVRLTGRLESRSEKDRVFKVTAIVKESPDEVLFKSEFERILKNNQRDAHSVLRLGRRIHRVHEEYPNTELYEILRKTVFECYRLAQRRLDSADDSAHFRLAMQLFGDIPDKDLHTQLLRYQITRYPDSEPIAMRLKKMGLRNLDGDWLEYAEFKQREGFVRFNDAWVTTAEKEFLETLETISRENLTNLILRSKTDRSYEQLAALGQAERGMNFREAAKALEFPERVFRKKLDHPEKTLVITQWVYEDQSVYFVDGLVFEFRVDSKR